MKQTCNHVEKNQNKYSSKESKCEYFSSSARDFNLNPRLIKTFIHGRQQLTCRTCYNWEKFPGALRNSEISANWVKF